MIVGRRIQIVQVLDLLVSYELEVYTDLTTISPAHCTLEDWLMTPQTVSKTPISGSAYSSLFRLLAIVRAYLADTGHLHARKKRLLCADKLVVDCSVIPKPRSELQEFSI